MAALNLSCNTKVLQVGATLAATLTPSASITDSATLSATFLPFGSAPGVVATTTAATAANSNITRQSDSFGYMSTGIGEALVINCTASGVGVDVTYAVG